MRNLTNFMDTWQKDLRHVSIKKHLKCSRRTKSEIKFYNNLYYKMLCLLFQIYSIFLSETTKLIEIEDLIRRHTVYKKRNSSEMNTSFSLPGVTSVPQLLSTIITSQRRSLHRLKLSFLFSFHCYCWYGSSYSRSWAPSLYS